jgi:hypothetical protein
MKGIDAIQQIMEDVTLLKTTMQALLESVNLIEANIKFLNNRAAGLANNSSHQQTTQVPIIAQEMSPPLSPLIEQRSSVLPESLQANSTMQSQRNRQLIETPQPETLSYNEETKTSIYKKVFGKLVDNANEPIEGVVIRVYDKNNEVCAATQTDAIGYWEAMLRDGRFVAEYNKSGFKPVNKTFEVSKNAQEVEIK